MLVSTRTMTLLLIVFAISMAVATFVESSFDTATAKTLIYNAKWFELLMFWLIVIFLVNIKTYRLTRKEKWPILIFHLAFVFIFIGGAITRYTSFEGQMPIKEGQTTNEIISDLTYFKLSITNGEDTRNYNMHPYTMSHFNSKDSKWPLNRTFTQNYIFYDKVVSLKSLDYIPLAKDSIQPSDSGKNILTIVSSSDGIRLDNTIAETEVLDIGGTLFSYNKAVVGSVQFIDQGEELMLVLPDDGHFLSMQGQQKGVLSDSGITSQNYGVIKANDTVALSHRTLYSIKNSSFVIPEKPGKGRKVYYSGDKTSAQDKNLLDAIWLEIKSGNERDTMLVKGGKGVTGLDKTIQINGMNISLGFGSKVLYTDFYLRCDDFLLQRYPGSTNPSSYQSKITVIDGAKEDQYHIYMNNVMDYKGYRFFQASYFPDESGTILSVNADKWGTMVTYLGYFMVFLGMFMTLFWNGTHFWKLNSTLKKLHTKGFLFVSILTFMGIHNGFSQGSLEVDHDTTNIVLQNPQSTSQFIKADELGSDRTINAAHAKKFGRLLVQDYQGRIKPMNTQTLELLRKLYKKDVYQNESFSISSDQWFIAMQIDPGYWANEPMIKVSSKGGDKFLKETSANSSSYTSYSKLVDLNTGNYVLGEQYKSSFSKRKADLSNYDKAVIELTERFNIFNTIAFGYYTKVIPIQNDPSHTWRSWIYSSQNKAVEIDTVAYKLLTTYFDATKQALKTGNWDKADKEITVISDFQYQWGKEVIPDKTKVTLEILYNQWNVFLWLMIAYSFLGIAMVVLGFAEVFSSGSRLNHMIRILTKLLLRVMILAVVVQAIALGVRWYLSGHAPWSNGYEAIIFISGIGVFSGLLLYRNRNAFIPAAGTLVAMIMMGFAHGGSMLDPQITPLEPVLKSYWLMIHVGIITSSYGFFGLSAVLSVITLLLFSSKRSQKIQRSIKELTTVNEMALTVGIFALGIGTFLGGMWANESWGRYWSWDPKETWAFISVIIYAVVLHLRLVPKLRGKLIFNMASLWAIWSIIFTYFGVNYYLVGLHSYAAGDPIPVPVWIYVTVASMLILSLVAYFRTRMMDYY